MKNRKFVFFSAVVGNILEYYDFTVYIVFLVNISNSFFAPDSELAKTLSALAVFAVGFVTRPIGGIIFGYLGDKYGRKISLICSMVGMTIPTFAIGLLPGYEDIGIYAPIILVILRLIQGLCISGEGTGAAIFVLEHYHNLKPGFITGLIHAMNILGTLTASLIGIAINRIFPEVDFAWRFAFILGGVFGLAGFYLRMLVSETPIFIAASRSKSKINISFFTLVKRTYKSMILSLSLGAFASILVYLVKAYINVFYSTVLKNTTFDSLAYVSYTSFIMMLVMPISGYISDVIGKTKTIKYATVLTCIIILPTFLCMMNPSFYLRILGLTLLAISAGGVSGSAYNFAISLFKPQYRFLGVGFSYNLGVAIFGGTSPIIARHLVEYTGVHYAPALYVMLVSAIFLAILAYFKTYIASIFSSK
ncbi:MAG: MFS transporter [Rickettsiaceae bacterium]|nr:MFS transporter [Rickettsiaceae bacterium]